jgi:uncharacterized protein (DUF433 family)
MKPSSVVHSDLDILGGAPVFVGTRVPLQALIDYLQGGHSLEEFLDDFPTVSREAAVAALEQEEVWAAEVEHRIADVESGSVHVIPIAEALARVRAALK